MILKLLYTIFVLIVCVIIYFNIRENEHSLAFIIVTGLITTIIGNLFIPSNISIFDIINNIKKASAEAQNSNSDIPSTAKNEEDDIFVSNNPTNESTPSKKDSTPSVKQSIEKQSSESFNEELNILSANNISKNINDITDHLLEISPIDLYYYEGNISIDDQIDTYQFTPLLNGRYRFEVSEMLSGVKVNIIVLNQAGEKVDGTYYGVENGNGLTIDNMVANEIYTVQVKQYFSYSSYKILLGSQKSTVNIDNGVTQITDSIQYTDQKNIYEFTPPLNGRYRFELDEMISGSKVNMDIYNPGGNKIDGTYYGIANGDGLTIDNMNAGETYRIFITQYTSNMDYKLLIGYQKEIVQINGETELSDSIQYTAQLNQYQFIPPMNGRYRFEISDITSGVKVNMNILNQAGGKVDSTYYGISKNEGLTIDNMIANETYTIQIIQYNSYSPYKLEIGYQKEPVELNVNSIHDTIQYTQQQNIYKFNPKANGNYSFVIDTMISGMKINISIYNEGGELIDGTWYGIDNGNKLLIENMIKDETYTIYITQYEGKGSYSMTIN